MPPVQPGTRPLESDSYTNVDAVPCCHGRSVGAGCDGTRTVALCAGVVWMRMLLRVRVPVDAGTAAITSGKLQETLEAVFSQMRPEAAYFATDGGKRGAFIVFDMQDPSQLPQIAEPLFHNMNAEVEFSPVMTLEDLQKGLQAAHG